MSPSAARYSGQPSTILQTPSAVTSSARYSGTMTARRMANSAANTHVRRVQTRTIEWLRCHAVGSSLRFGSPPATMKPTSGQRTAIDSTLIASMTPPWMSPGRNTSEACPERFARNAARAVANAAMSTNLSV